MAESPWVKFEAQTWTETVSELGGMEITFRESGSAAALLRLFDHSGSTDEEEAAAARLICTSIVDPHIDEAQFHALSLKAKMTLLQLVTKHIEGATNPDFPKLSPTEDGDDETEEPSQETTDGGSGAPQRLSVSVGPRN